MSNSAKQQQNNLTRLAQNPLSPERQRTFKFCHLLFVNSIYQHDELPWETRTSALSSLIVNAKQSLGSYPNPEQEVKLVFFISATDWVVGVEHVILPDREKIKVLAQFQTIDSQLSETCHSLWNAPPVPGVMFCLECSLQWNGSSPRPD